MSYFKREARGELRQLDRSIRLQAFQDFAVAHPHECHAKWPWRFWILFHNMLPYVSRERMKELLEETK